MTSTASSTILSAFIDDSDADDDGTDRIIDSAPRSHQRLGRASRAIILADWIVDDARRIVPLKVRIVSLKRVAVLDLGLERR
jgi:hypothetical protein